MGRPRVVITGMGAVSPIGVGVRAYARGLREGRSGVGLLGFEHPKMKSSVAAVCRDFDPLSVMSEVDVRRLPRLVPMALAAAGEAMAEAGLARQSPVANGKEQAGQEEEVESSRRIGLILGTGGGGIDFTLEQYAAAYEGGRASLWTITNATHGNLAGELSIRLGLRGPSLCVSTGCASSSDAGGMALEMLRGGRPGGPAAMVVVGADAHVKWEILHTMELLGVISTRDFRAGGDAGTASRPFDATRDGFVLGEGAWAVVLEREGHARERGARVIAELMGYGVTCDAYHRVRPDPGMAESARAMRGAMEDAGLGPADVGVVHYHGTGTALNDAVETAAVKAALGEGRARGVAGHSVKSQIGHPQGACGMAALVATLAGLTGADGGEPFIPPTINLRERDPACDLDYVREGARATSARVALINCLAFGAKNSVLVAGVERANGE
ncbi:MAG: beta-ketoacyl-[acyl-carrier-protein] synthase family protein [Phycisphaerales bacterium]|nr:beta-ketoacyl-[acyl-carrier-protein] synthase family protein [Phycisphaerales bacterium]